MFRSTRLLPFLQLQLNVVIMGFTGVLGRLITLDALNLVWWRVVLTLLGFLLLFSWRLKELFRNYGVAVRAFGLGFLLGLHFLSFYSSIKLSNITIALVTFSLTSVFSSLLEPILLKKPFSLFDLSVGSLVLILMAWMFNAAFGFWQGFLWGIAAALFYAVLTVLNSQLVQNQKSTYLMFWETLGAGFVIGAALFLSKYPLLGMTEISLSNWGWLLVMAWVCTLYCYTSLVHLLKYFPPFTLNLTINLEPIYGIIFAILIFREQEWMSGHFYYALVGLLFIISSYPFLKRRLL